MCLPSSPLSPDSQIVPEKWWRIRLSHVLKTLPQLHLPIPSIDPGCMHCPQRSVVLPTFLNMHKGRSTSQDQRTPTSWKPALTIATHRKPKLLLILKLYVLSVLNLTHRSSGSQGIQDEINRSSGSQRIQDEIRAGFTGEDFFFLSTLASPSPSSPPHAPSHLSLSVRSCVHTMFPEVKLVTWKT